MLATDPDWIVAPYQFVPLTTFEKEYNPFGEYEIVNVSPTLYVPDHIPLAFPITEPSYLPPERFLTITFAVLSCHQANKVWPQPSSHTVEDVIVSHV